MLWRLLHYLGFFQLRGGARWKIIIPLQIMICPWAASAPCLQQNVRRQRPRSRSRWYRCKIRKWSRAPILLSPQNTNELYANDLSFLSTLSDKPRNTHGLCFKWHGPQLQEHVRECENWWKTQIRTIKNIYNGNPQILPFLGSPRLLSHATL